jgi:hypothetical protein
MVSASHAAGVYITGKEIAATPSYVCSWQHVLTSGIAVYSAGTATGTRAAKPKPSHLPLIKNMDKERGNTYRTFSKTTVKLTRPEVEEMATYYKDKVKSMNKL